MDWAKDRTGNRNPIVVVDGSLGLEVLSRKPQLGTNVTLDASGSLDPDSDPIIFRWWIVSDAGTHDLEIKITNSDSSVSTIEIPSDSAGKTFHVICEVTDNGTPSLTGYRRIVFEPTK